MNRRATVAAELAAYAIRIALGQVDVPAEQKYSYELGQGHDYEAPIVPEAIHAALCHAGPGAILLCDEAARINVCDACGLAIKLEDQ